MSGTPELTAEEVCRWVKINVRRIKRLRMLQNRDVARRMNCTLRAYLQTMALGNRTMTMRTLISVANALEMTPAELLTRPDDMTVTDERTTWRSLSRKKAKFKLTEEQQQRLALLKSMGLDD